MAYVLSSNPRSSRRTIAILTATQMIYDLCGSNPRSSRRTIAIGNGLHGFLNGEGFQSSIVPKNDRNLSITSLKPLIEVPILDRPEERSQLSGLTMGVGQIEFQSSIVPKNDRNKTSPTLVTITKIVPILDRPEERSQFYITSL